MFDLVIRNGTLIDGTGAPAVVADVAVDGERIAAVGEVGRGKREIDAKGYIVTPGFVDLHVHYDAQVTWDPYLTPSSWHGCTTVVMGNCGVGFAPAKPDRHGWLISLMEGVEDIPGSALHEGIVWDWESFPEFLDAIERRPHAIDFGAQISHGALRGYVMGERGAANEDATAEDIATMSALVHEALEAGALGFSTSRTVLHKSMSGEPVPGTFAGRDELFGIGRALAETGRGVFQLAAEHPNVEREFEWMQELARQTGRPVMFNLTQADQAPDLWRRMLSLMEGAAAEGLNIWGQVAGRAIGVLMNWQLTAHPFVAYQSYLPYWHMPHAERMQQLRNPEVRSRILADQPLHLGDFENFVTRTYEKMYALGDSVDYEPRPQDSVAAIAQSKGVSPAEVAYDLMCADDGQGMLYFPLFNYADGDLEMLRTLHNHPLTRMGLSDAGAHCGAVCDGGMPTFMLTHWTRDRTRGERLPLEHVVRRQTRDTAHTFGMYDRGVVAPGRKADLNVIDYDRLRFRRPEVVFDLPAGGRRLIQRADGYVATICSGAIIAEHGKATGAMPGRLVRGPQNAG